MSRDPVTILASVALLLRKQGRIFWQTAQARRCSAAQDIPLFCSLGQSSVGQQVGNGCSRIAVDPIPIFAKNWLYLRGVDTLNLTIARSRYLTVVRSCRICEYAQPWLPAWHGSGGRGMFRDADRRVAQPADKKMVLAFERFTKKRGSASSVKRHRERIIVAACI